MERISIKGKFFKKVISGSPSVVINKDGVVIKELKKNNMSVDDLIESMRTSGYFSLDDLYYAIYESNGQLSAFENSSRENAPTSLPLLIVSDGKIDKSNCEVMDAPVSAVQEFIKKQARSIKEVEVMTVDGNGRVYFKRKNKPYQILNFPIKESAKW